jgi:glutamate--cysteine ligase catalytic subunit
MGLLTEGSPLYWPETKKYADHVRQHGITQLLYIVDRLKERENDCLKWGDEVTILF